MLFYFQLDLYLNAPWGIQLNIIQNYKDFLSTALLFLFCRTLWGSGDPAARRSSLHIASWPCRVLTRGQPTGQDQRPCPAPHCRSHGGSHGAPRRRHIGVDSGEACAVFELGTVSLGEAPGRRSFISCVSWGVVAGPPHPGFFLAGPQPGCRGLARKLPTRTLLW